jgi:hypothetical protein
MKCPKCKAKLMIRKEYYDCQCPICKQWYIIGADKLYEVNSITFSQAAYELNQSIIDLGLTIKQEWSEMINKIKGKSVTK